MKVKRLLSIYAIGSFLLICASPGMAAITIDFETLADLEVVDNQFLALGADFNGTATVLRHPGSLNYPTFPPYSGEAVIYDTSGGSGTIRVDAVGQQWIMAGGYVTGNRDVTLTAYDSSGSVLGTDNTGGANYAGAGTGLLPNIFLSVSAPSIAYVEFTDGGNTYTVDDFTYEVIPAPGAILLGSIGIGLVGYLRRRKTI